MKLSRRENLVMVDSSGVESTCITSTGGGKFAALEASNFTSTGDVTASAGYFVDKNAVKLNYVENGTTTANLVAYGVSLLEPSTAAQTIKKYTLNAPIKGIFKDLLVSSSGAVTGSSDVTIVTTGSSNIDILSYGTTLLTGDLHNIAMQSPYTYARLLGLSTSRWGITDFQTASTLAPYKAIAGLSSGLSTAVFVTT
jgi:hypothetical protein